MGQAPCTCAWGSWPELVLWLSYRRNPVGRSDGEGHEVEVSRAVPGQDSCLLFLTTSFSFRNERCPRRASVDNFST